MPTLDEFDYVRRMYDVPARMGGRIRFEEREGTIIGANHYLIVQFDGEKRIRFLSPEWNVEYLSATEATNGD